MQCPRCLNTDENYFYHGSKGWYCRKCIPFGRAMLDEEKQPVQLSPVTEGSEEYLLKYPLTEAQEKVSAECASLIDTTDTMLWCICGAGKTELVLASIHKYLAKRKRVCFAIPRRQVVLELRERLARYFPNAKVTAICGGHTSDLEGDLLVCTTHQLYRFYQTFDLLILDEPDAFPFKGNPVLHGIAMTSVKGHIIYLTATPDAQLNQKVKKKEIAVLKLNRRPHGHPLPVPRIITAMDPVLFFRLWQWLKAHANQPCMVFVPTIRMAEILGRILGMFFDCTTLTSRTENRDERMNAFVRKKKGIIVATTVLERGVTVENAQVAVVFADHAVFDEASLTQIAGRAGRTFAFPDGDVLFLLRKKSDDAMKCLKAIQEANRCAV